MEKEKEERLRWGEGGRKGSRDRSRDRKKWSEEIERIWIP